MNATLSRDNLLSMLFTLSKPNQKWIANRLYENIGAVAKSRETGKEAILADLSEAFTQVKNIEKGTLQPVTMEELFDAI